MFGGLEFDIDVYHFVGEDEILIVSTHPRRFGSVFDFWDAETGENEIRIDLGGILQLDSAAVRHQIAELGALSRD